MVTHPSLKILKDKLKKAGILNERIAKDLDTANNIFHAESIANFFINMKKKLEGEL